MTMIWRNFQQNFNIGQKQLGHRLGEEVGKNIDKLTEFIEDVAEKVPDSKIKPFLYYALDYLRPTIRSLGLRISHLNNYRIEMILPADRKNLNSMRRIEEGALISSALIAYKTLWFRNVAKGALSIDIKQVHYESIKPALSDVHLKWELENISRENALADLFQNRSCEHEAIIQVFDFSNQVVGLIKVVGNLVWCETLDWK